MISNQSPGDTRPTVSLGITEAGSGIPLILTHGWADTRKVWDGIISELGIGYQTFSWDLRGHGESAKPQAGLYSREHALADLKLVTKRAKRPVVLIGHSLGGYLSLAYALRYPQHVQALVLIAAGPGFRKKEARDQWNAAIKRSARKLNMPIGSEELSMHIDSWVIDNLNKITAPTLVITGERDKRFAAAAEVFEKKLNVQASIVLPTAGHRLHVQLAGPVAKAIRDFLLELN